MSIETEVAFLPQGYTAVLVSYAAYWLLLALPGFALLRRFLPGALSGGLPSTLALSYLASFVLLSPVSIAGYVLRLPLFVMSAAIVLAVVVAAAWLIRERMRGRLRLARPPLSPVALIAGALIAVDALFGLRVGSNFGGDGRYHAARVRMLFDLGFNNWDPFLAGHRFDAIYHTNLYHPLIGASAQLTVTQPAAAWAFCLFWAKLACAAATYHLAFTLLGRRWVAWMAAAFLDLWLAANAFVSYPNMLSVYFFLPLAWAFLVELNGEGDRRNAVLGLAAVAWVLPQVHALYYVFLCLLGAPLLLLSLALRRSRAAGRRQAMAALLVLGLGAPWIGVTEWQRTHPAPQPSMPHAHPAPLDPAHPPWSIEQRANKRRMLRDSGFVQLANGELMLDPRPMIQLGSSQLQLILLLAFGLTLGRRRRELEVAAGIVLLAMVMLYVPPLCTALAKLAGAPWIVRRLSAVPVTLYFALFPGVLLVALPEVLLRPVFQAVYLGGALAYAYANGVDSGHWKRADYVERAIAGKPLYDNLHGHAMRRALCERNLPAGAVVVADFERGAQLGVDCNAYPLALPIKDPNHGLRDMDQRRADVITLLDPDADAATRMALLRYYGVRHIWIYGYKNFLRLRRAYRPWIIKTEKYRKHRIVTLDVRALAKKPLAAGARLR